MLLFDSRFEHSQRVARLECIRKPPRPTGYGARLIISVLLRGVYLYPFRSRERERERERHFSRCKEGTESAKLIGSKGDWKEQREGEEGPAVTEADVAGVAGMNPKKRYGLRSRDDDLRAY